MAAKTRVHELAHELGADSKSLLDLLKELGEYVKSPSATLQPPVVRKARAAWQAKQDSESIPPSLLRRPDDSRAAGARDAPLSEHPAAIAAAIRAEVVQRSESDWSRFGFSDAERSAWLSAGIPEDKAHVAAMVRDSARRDDQSPRITMESLSRRIGDRSVLDLLLSGRNALRVEAHLARAEGGSIRGVNADLLRLATSQAVAPEDGTPMLSEAVKNSIWAPVEVPAVGEATSLLLASTMPWMRAQLAIRLQVRAYRERREVQPLLAAFARVHGVFHVDSELDRLCDGVEVAPGDFAVALDFIRVMEKAIASGRYSYFRVDAVEQLEETAVTSQEEPLPPAPAGFALLEERTVDGVVAQPARVLAWATDGGGRVECTLFPRSRLHALTPDKLARNAPVVSTYDHGASHTAGSAAAYLATLAATRTRPLGASRAHSSTGMPSTARSSVDTKLRGVVTVYFSAGSDAPIAAAPRRAPDHRWSVRAHSRRQFYRSNGEHRVIQIEEHTAGPRDAPLLNVQRVEVF